MGRTHADASQKRSLLRTIPAVVLGFVAIVALVVSTLALWSQATLFDGDRVAAVAAEAVAAPGATDALAVHLTDEISQAIDLAGRLDTVLPGPLEGVSPVVADTADSVVRAGLENALRTQEIRSLLVELVRRAHGRFVDILESDGGSGGLDVEEDTVSVNLLPLVTIGLEKIQDVGILSSLDVPQFAADGDPAEQIAELEARLGDDLPDDFGQLVVFRDDAVSSASQQVQTARDVLVLAKRGTIAVVALTVVSLGFAILLAHRRRRAVVSLGLACAAVMVAARLSLDRIAGEIPDLVDNPGARSALDAAVQYLSDNLVGVITAFLVVGLVAAGIACLVGPGRVATRLRGLAKRQR